MLSFAPTLSGQGPAVVVGTPYNFKLDWTGTASVNSVTFNWGDGTSPTTVTSGITDPYTISHTYTTTTRFTPTAQVTPSSGSTVTIPLSLDANFGSSTEPGTIDSSITTGQDAAFAEVIQPNSDVLSAGVSNGDNFEVERWTPAGASDNTFGSSLVNGTGTAGGGKEDINFGGGTTDQAYALALDPSGDIVAAGTDSGNFAIAMLTPAGVPDTSFGGGTGMVTTAFSGYTAVATSVAIQPLSSGSYDIVVAGYVDVPASCSSWGSANFAIARYTSAGVLDTTFNSSGKEIVSAAPETDHDFAQALQIQPNPSFPTVPSDDAYVLGGYDADYSSSGSCGCCGSCGSCGSGLVSQDFALTRLSYSGGTTGFGTDCNWALTEIGTTETGSGCCSSCGCTGPSIDSDYSLVIQPDGKLVAAGSTVVEDNPSSFALARYSANGVLDTSFGTNGVVATPFSSGAVGYGATLQTVDSNTDIVVAGCVAGGIGNSEFALARYTPSGSLDSTFGSGGTITTDIQNGTGSAQAVAIDPTTSDIIAVGSTGTVGSLNFALAAFLRDNRVHVTLPEPSGFTASSVTSTSMTLGWSAETGVSSWIVQELPPGANSWTTIATPGASTLTDSLTGLTADKPYDFALFAVDSAGDLSPPATLSTATLPATPTGLTATAVSGSKINLAWVNPNTSLATQVLQSATGTAPWTTLATLAAGVSTYSSTGLTPQSRYYYSVVAADGTNLSAPAAVQSATTLAGVPTSFSGTGNADGSITLTWQPGAGDSGGFSLSRGTSSLGNVSGSPHNDAASNLTIGTAYTYTVAAANGGTDSSSYATVTVTAPPPMPTNLTATPASGSQINLTWSESDPNAEIQVQRSDNNGGTWTTVETTAAGASGWNCLAHHNLWRKAA